MTVPSGVLLHGDEEVKSDVTCCRKGMQEIPGSWIGNQGQPLAEGCAKVLQAYKTVLIVVHLQINRVLWPLLIFNQRSSSVTFPICNFLLLDPAALWCRSRGRCHALWRKRAGDPGEPGPAHLLRAVPRSSRLVNTIFGAVHLQFAWALCLPVDLAKAAVFMLSYISEQVRSATCSRLYLGLPGPQDCPCCCPSAQLSSPLL